VGLALGLVVAATSTRGAVGALAPVAPGCAAVAPGVGAAGPIGEAALAPGGGGGSGATFFFRASFRASAFAGAFASVTGGAALALPAPKTTTHANRNRARFFIRAPRRAHGARNMPAPEIRWRCGFFTAAAHYPLAGALG
jgi:hypothetical protein